MKKDAKQAVVESKIVGMEHVVYDKEVELSALEAESTLGSEGEYDERLQSAKLDLEKSKARLKAYKDELKSLG